MITECGRILFIALMARDSELILLIFSDQEEQQLFSGVYR